MNTNYKQEPVPIHELIRLPETIYDNKPEPIPELPTKPQLNQIAYYASKYNIDYLIQSAKYQPDTIQHATAWIQRLKQLGDNRHLQPRKHQLSYQQIKQKLYSKYLLKPAQPIIYIQKDNQLRFNINNLI